MAKEKITKQFGKTQWLVYNQTVPVSTMDKRKYYIKKGGKSVAKLLNDMYKPQKSQVQYVRTGQKVDWDKSSEVFEVLDYDVRRDNG